MTKDLLEYRKDFPLLEKEALAYLDNAATSQKPQCVLDAVMKYYQEDNANPMRGLYDLSVRATKVYEEARRKTAKYLNASRPEEIVFTRNASESLNLIAYSYGLDFIKEGDEILVGITEHHSNLLPWRMVAEKTGAKVKYIECQEDGSISEDYFKSLLSEKTKLVALTHLSNVIGRQYPVKRFIELAHQVGAVFVLDICQSMAHIKIDIQDLDADFAAFSGHKMFAPMGIGGLYGKYELLDKMSPFLRGGEMIETVTLEGQTYAEVPHKFEAGTVNAGGARGLSAAIDYIEKVGMENIAKREEELTRRALEGLKDYPYIKILGAKEAENHHGIISFAVEGVHPHDIAEILSHDGIAIRAGHHCAQPLLSHLGVRSSARASISFYNTEEEVDKFVKSVKSLRGKMGYDQ
ncbi:MAG: SufS family cysteine desulfurase [Bacillota bacterium]|nr:SufS family cysteine desulfurase [Bacillota bacterium]